MSDLLVVGGVRVPVALGGADLSYTEVGEVATAFDGTPRSSVRRRTLVASVQTVPMAPAAASALLAALHGGASVTCSGTLLGNSMPCVVREVRVRPVRAGAEVRRQVSFQLLGP